ncbi:hypothetical protein [Chondromyces apiculatus]|uniref:Uncharacterized protein n=1 Tax=Chondromyces apiculatus DSM 436 TaxID=1192034 RepID=A0A017TGP4_9BACT|nr:hypothetical protein [Chondromyces apiculatus]EYF08057.1 Hypothetical protein CAP_5817 [Chondromyces apiculatus DSM 436]
MVFRAPAQPYASGSVRYGPFPVRWKLVFFAGAALLSALVLALVALARDHLVCTPGARCVVSTAPWMSVRAAVPMAALRDARADLGKNTKGNAYGVVVLVLDGGGEVRLQRASVDEAQQAAATIRARLAVRQRIDVTVGGSWWLLLFSAGALAAGVSMASTALKGAVTFRLDLVQGGQALRVRKQLLGVPLPGATLSLAGVTDVRVEGARTEEAWSDRAEAPLPAGRLVLVDRTGATQPITASALPGTAVHLRAASALRALLQMPLQRDVEAQLASLPWRRTPPGARLVLAASGATMGGLLGVGALAVAGIALGVLDAREGRAWVFVVGGVAGAAVGLALAVFFTRPQPPA